MRGVDREDKSISNQYGVPEEAVSFGSGAYALGKEVGMNDKEAFRHAIDSTIIYATDLEQSTKLTDKSNN